MSHNYRGQYETRVARLHSRHGVPEEILTDNGRVFTGKHQPKPATVLFDRICQNNEIKHRLTAPYSPTTTGKVERFHRTMRREFFELATYDTLKDHDHDET